MSSLLLDIRYGLRLLARNPGFAVVSVVTLALGIGLTTSMFTIVNAAILKGLPYHESERLMYLERSNPDGSFRGADVTIHDFEAWREQQRAFEDLAAYYTGTVNLSGTERAERFDGAFISASAFPMLRVRPYLGRLFRPGEDAPGADPVILLGYEVWQSQYNGDPEIIGQTVRANGEQMTVVGVMPPDFFFPYDETVWIPLRRSAATEQRGEGFGLRVVGRLLDEVSVDQANVQMSAIAQRLATAYPETNQGVRVRGKPYIEAIMNDEPRALLYTMLGAVFLVLLIACVNVANLLLSQAAMRTKEVGIRAAIGASRVRIVVQFLTEPLVLAAIGGALGIGIARVAVWAFERAIAGTGAPRYLDFSIDGRVLLFVLGLILFATLASGVFPALRASAANTNEVLKDESRGASSFRLGRLSRALVVFEIALSCGLLVAAGLMIKSVAQLRTIDFGFATDDVFTARLGLPEIDYPDSAAQVRFFDAVLGGLAAHPDVRAASLTTALPALGSGRQSVALEGAAYAEDRDYPEAAAITAAPALFATLDVAVLQGREFTAQDRAGSLPVAIVNSSFAQRHFPGRSPLGQRVRLGGADSEQPWRTIVGLVPDLYVSGVENENPEAVYLPLAQQGGRFMSVVARGRGEPLALAAPVREVVSGVDADVPLYFVDTLGGAIHRNNWHYRVFGTIFMIMGFVALFLAAIGLYGVMAFSVSRRTREMGVRRALGAQARDVVRLVLRQAVAQLGAGLVLGLALAAAVSQLLSALLFQVQPRDPLVFGSIALVLALTGLLASWVPARRATRVDPMLALRE